MSFLHSQRITSLVSPTLIKGFSKSLCKTLHKQQYSSSEAFYLSGAFGCTKSSIDTRNFHLSNIITRNQQFSSSSSSDEEENTTIRQIIQKIRWAPSGDNHQPWRFEIINKTQFVIHGFDTRSHCVYDLLGHATYIAMGALIENLYIAARKMGLRADLSKASLHTNDESRIVIHVSLSELESKEGTDRTGDTTTDENLYDYIEKRCVNRRPLSTNPLTPKEKQELEKSVAALGYSLVWKESHQDRLNTALFLQKNGKLRLITPEGYATHSSIIEYGVNESKDRIPSPAVGLDPLGIFLMKWVLDGGWKRADFVNKYMGGTLLPRLQLDLLPGYFCASHFILLAPKEESPPKAIEDFIKAGRALQRLWLTATKIGLQFQPEATPVIFSNYVRNQVAFSTKEESLAMAKSISQTLNHDMLNGEGNRAVFMGRIGNGKTPKARSIRKTVDELVITAQQQ